MNRSNNSTCSNLLPFFRRGRVTSLFECLEARFGPKKRVYGASVFLLSQCIRISMVQYLVALLMHSLTGWSVPVCLLLGGAVTAYYTIAGGWGQLISTAAADGKLLFGEPGSGGHIQAIPWGFPLTRKTFTMLLAVGVIWLPIARKPIMCSRPRP